MSEVKLKSIADSQPSDRSMFGFGGSTLGPMQAMRNSFLLLATYSSIDSDCYLNLAKKCQLAIDSERQES